MAKMTNIPGEKLLIKLWDTLADKGIAGWFKPYQIRREGRAQIDIEVERIVRLAQANKDAEAISNGEQKLLNNGENCFLEVNNENIPSTSLNTPLVESEQSKNLIEEMLAEEARHVIRKQTNLTKAILYAAAHLETDTSSVPEKTISDDWLYRWRDAASDFSHEETQKLWGRLLAGEIKSPGAFSLRTIDFLRNITQEEAIEIQKLAPFIIDDFVFRAHPLLDSFGVSFNLMIKLQEIGILSGVDSIGWLGNFDSKITDKYLYTFIVKDRILILENDNPLMKAKATVYLLTKVGKEIIKLCDDSINEVYLKALGQHFVDAGFNVKIAKIKKINPSQSASEITVEHYDAQTL